MGVISSFFDKLRSQTNEKTNETKDSEKPQGIQATIPRSVQTDEYNPSYPFSKTSEETANTVPSGGDIGIWSAQKVYEVKSRMLVEEAKKWVGIRESGANQGIEVQRFQKAVDGKAQGEPWCLSFVQFCVKEVDRKFQELYPVIPNRPSWLYPTEHCLTLWNKTPVKGRQAIPTRAGSLFLWQWFKDARPTAQGHVGIIAQIHSDFATTVEGNTSDGSGMNREGDGVFIKTRPFETKGEKFKVLGFLSPWDEDEPVIG